MNEVTFPQNYNEEVKQSYSRLIFVPIILSVMFYLESYKTILQSLVFQAIVIYAVLSLAIFFFLKLRPNDLIIFRKLSFIVLDVGIISITMAVLNENAYLFLFLYLWIIMGYGIRFGLRYLDFSLLVSLIGFGYLVTNNTFFTEHWQVSSGALNIIIILSLFFRILIKRLEYKNELIIKTADAKGKFLANMSHEIRTPLNAILGFIKILNESEKDTKRLEYFSIIKESGESLLSIINDILDFSKIDSHKLSLEERVFETKKPFEASYLLFKEAADKKGISLKFEYKSEIPQYMVSDETRLKQVVINLLSNAIKFTSKNGVIILSVSYKKHEDTLCISVKDNGIGISKVVQESIFNAFEQADTSTTRKFGGTGLGLSISSAIISLMGSKLEVKSVVGSYTKFFFELSFEYPSKEVLCELQMPLETSSVEQMQGKVLVVEDNQFNQKLMCIHLEEYGLEYEIANNGAEAVEMFKTFTYDIILMDENMPIMNGKVATKIIREYEREKSLKATPIVAQSANALNEDILSFLDAGMDDAIAKPIDEEVLYMTLYKYLQKD
ncbi:response regulator [Sulfurimonas sp. SAG-AH-194-C20]|nr:ATP-binding protein [Sulfurimonas sp. SAG-AH-194-C20]MDF1879432.1 response regulator [Sulfurimonas sp. SAG-AH-194-C20]